MRIGFLGNQNNYPFILARALRRAGHDVLVIIDEQHALDRPEARYDDVSYPYPEWIREVEPIRMVDIVYRSARWEGVLSLLRSCDALVLNRWGFAAAADLDRPTFCLTTGADIELWSNPAAMDRYLRDRLAQASVNYRDRAFACERFDRETLWHLLDGAPRPLHRTWHRHLFRQFVQRQRTGLRRAVGINAFPDGAVPPTAGVMQECLGPGAMRTFFMLAEIASLTPQPLPNNDALRLFNGARILWQQPFPPMVGEWENKGTDVLLRGVALWHQHTKGTIDVRLADKGPSVQATKELIDQLNIAHLVTWHRELTQRDLFHEYARADIVSDQCGTHLVGMAGYEAMALGRPVLANGRPEVFGPAFGEAPPVAQARTPAEVATQIGRLSLREERERLADKGRRFVEQHLSPERAASIVVRLLQDALKGRAPATAA